MTKKTETPPPAENADDSQPLTADQKRIQLAGHLAEAERLGLEILQVDARKMNVDLGPDIPDLATARNDPRVLKASAALRDATDQLGTVWAVVSLIEAVAGRLGVVIPN